MKILADFQICISAPLNKNPKKKLKTIQNKCVRLNLNNRDHIKIACRVQVAYLKEQDHHFFTYFLNKFVRHVFNSILKLIITFVKKYKINFLWEKMAPKIVVFQS